MSAFLGLTACSSPPQPGHVGMANPASVYCEKQGGKTIIKKTPTGEVGLCHLPDGQIVDEWEFFRKSK
jgi:putative hemolysin